MAYNFTKGPQKIDDLVASMDPEKDTKIDFGDNKIDFIIGGVKVVSLTPTSLSASLFQGDGTQLTGVSSSNGSSGGVLDPTLQAIANITSSADRYIYFTGVDQVTTGTITTFGRSLIDDANNASARITLGLGDIVTQNSSTISIAGGNINNTSIGFSNPSTGRFTNLSASTLDVSDPATTRANLGLAIGTNVQAYDTTLATIASLNPTTNQFIYFTNTNVAAVGTISTLGRDIIDSSTTASAQSTLGLTLGTDVQGYSTTLEALRTAPTASTYPGFVKYYYFNSPTTAVTGNMTAYARDFLINNDQVTARNYLGLQGMAIQENNNVSIGGGAINATQIGNTTQASGRFTSLSASLDANFASNANFYGPANFNSSVIVGNDTGDGIAINGTITTNIVPNIDNTVDFGTTTRRWRNVYSDTIRATSSNGHVVAGTGSNNSIVECSTAASNTYRGVRMGTNGVEKWFAGADLNDEYVIRKDGTTDYFNFNGSGLLSITQLYDDNRSGIKILDADATGKEYWNIYITNSAISTNALYFQAGSGVNGGFLSYTTNQSIIDFTGQHRNIVDTNSQININEHIGLIVVASGKYKNSDLSDKPSINESLPTIKLSDTRNQKSVWGVVSDCEDPNDTSRQYKIGIFVSVISKQNQDDNRIIVNSIGEGAVWICNINGNLQNGDYITTCEVPGLGMKQDSEFLANYTVAKITQDCDFELNNPNYDCVEFVHNGVTYKKAFVGCTYHCG